MRFYLLKFNVDVLRPAIDNDVDLLTRVTESIKNLKGALCAADTGDVKSHQQQDVVGKIERGHGYGIENVLEIQNQAVVALGQEMKCFCYVLGLDVLGLVSLGRGSQDRE